MTTTEPVSESIGTRPDRGMVSVEAFDTFEAAAALADDAVTMPDGALHQHPDAEIYRDHRGPGWGLRCSTIQCGDASWLVDWAGDEWQALGARDDIADLAREEGWAAHPGGYWTCPDCSRQYH